MTYLMSYVLCLIHLMYFSLMLGRVMLTCDSFALVGWTSTPKGGLVMVDPPRDPARENRFLNRTSFEKKTPRIYWFRGLAASVTVRIWNWRCQACRLRLFRWSCKGVLCFLTLLVWSSDLKLVYKCPARSELRQPLTLTCESATSVNWHLSCRKRFWFGATAVHS